MYRLLVDDGNVILGNGTIRLRICFVNESIVRVTLTDKKPFEPGASLIVTSRLLYPDYTLNENETNFIVSTSMMKVIVDKTTGGITYLNNKDEIVVREPSRGGKWLTSKKVSRTALNRPTWRGGKSIVNANELKENNRDVFEAKLELIFVENEAIFGLGCHEEGYGNLRGKTRQLYQHNHKISIPYLVSTRGYGLLIDCCSLMTYHDDPDGTYLWCDVVQELDFYLIIGNKFDEISRGYHLLTGDVPLFPKWSFGYVQSKERYVNSEEMIGIVREYRRREIPLDLIVLDWKSWDEKYWGQKSFDPIRFPSPKQFLDRLHSLNVHLMISIWPMMGGNCPDEQQMRDKGFLLGDGSTYNPLLSDARDLFWNQTNEGLFVNGVDGWWCDNSEPFVGDWGGIVRPESHLRLMKNVECFKEYLDPSLINVYSLYHSKGIYEGQRRTTSKKRVLNLTRSGYAGQHRYSTVVWNGDLSATWEVYRRCIPEGVNYCVTGEPYWTVDIGAFFLSYDENTWYWHGAFSEGCRGLTPSFIIDPDPKDTGCRDLSFWELYARWFQYGAFLPMFRSHGTDAAREIWRFGEVGTPFYDNIAKYIRLRYELIPYIYSLAGQITLNSCTMMCAIALHYPNDTKTFDLIDQYLFGPALMICPVTTPMYYTRNSQPLSDVPKSRRVYLPEGNQWFDFWTEIIYDGGQTISGNAPLDTIPIYVPTGSILPMTQVMQYVDQIPQSPYQIRIYRGRDANFTIYEDAGDNYQYEQGLFALINLSWMESIAQLTIEERKGTFPEMIEERQYDLIFISKQGRLTKTVNYTGKQIQISATE